MANQQVELQQKPLKLLVLIIASDDQPVYIGLEKLWRSYMHRDPEHVQAYFIKGNPRLETDFSIEGDIIWARTEESLCPGIINKTILSLEAMMPIIDQFDYVLRTNLSSFYLFDRLLKRLEEFPRTKFCYGSIVMWPGCWSSNHIPSGCGYVFSTDMAKLMVVHKEELIDNASLPDDILSGMFLHKYGASYVEHDRFPIWSIESWDRLKNNISPDIFQIRVKNITDSNRYPDDLVIYQQLVNTYYPE